MFVIMVMHVEYICLTSLNAMQIKVSSALAYDFNQLIYAVCGPPRPADLDPCPLPRFLALPRPVPPREKSLPCTSLV